MPLEGRQLCDNSVSSAKGLTMDAWLETFGGRIFDLGLFEFDNIFALGLLDGKRTRFIRVSRAGWTGFSGRGMSYTVRYWIGSRILGSTSRRERTL
jgi:hypothetical protein